MAKKSGGSGKKRPIESYEHRDKERVNNPPVGLVTPETDPDVGKKKTYQYDPHLDPQLQWAGKTEHTAFEVPTVSLHVHERIAPRSIIEAVRKRNGGDGQEQLSFFELLAGRVRFIAPFLRVCVGGCGAMNRTLRNRGRRDDGRLYSEW